MKTSTLFSIARARVFSAPAPIAVGFELTHLCNLSCNYCDRHQRLQNEMTLDQITTALDGLHSIGMREISLDGGEALAHPNVERVVDWLQAHDIVMRLNTNGVLVRRKADVVRKMKLVKISLDGPAKIHDSIRGQGAFTRALDALAVCNALSIPTELTCAVGKHNARFIDDVVSLAESVRAKVIFQPVRPSLFQDAGGPATHLALHASEAEQVFAQIEAHKRAGRPVLNAWASLRHFKGFPRSQPLPCAAGWINVTLDPEGNLYHCGQVSRADKTNNVVRLGAKAAFDALTRQGCEQCWCARVVEENYAWGGRFDKFLPVRRTATAPVASAQRQVTTFEVPVGALVKRRTCR